MDSRAWTETLSDRLEVCSCKRAGVDLGGLVHYRVRSSKRDEGRVAQGAYMFTTRELLAAVTMALLIFVLVRVIRKRGD
jgi:hypothetical protein